MILLSLGFVKSTAQAAQSDLWGEIQTNTAGGFPIVEACGDEPSLEWATHPNALKTTLNSYIGRNSIKVIPDSDEDAIAGHALDSVDAKVPACVLVEDATHWVVVFGCEISKRHPSPDGGPTHMLVRDPALSGLPMRITMDKWIAEIYAVDCGAFQNKYVVVGAR
jgi:hypothetical protein